MTSPRWGSSSTQPSREAASRARSAGSSKLAPRLPAGLPKPLRDFERWLVEEEHAVQAAKARAIKHDLARPTTAPSSPRSLSRGY